MNQSTVDAAASFSNQSQWMLEIFTLISTFTHFETIIYAVCSVCVLPLIVIENYAYIWVRYFLKNLDDDTTTKNDDTIVQ